MKQQMKRLAAVLGMVSLVALAGCGGGGGTATSTTPTTPTTTSVSGVVADGYLLGAKVCLDKNNNKKCDSDEPSAITTAGGHYTLASVSSADIAAYPILVEVTPSATDEQRGAVTAGYVLTAPAGKTDFISPLTTLIQNQVETTGVSADDAERTVRNSLGLSSSTSLFADFKPGDASASADQKLAASVAKVVATTIATNKAAIETAVGGSNTTVDAVVKLIIQQVLQQLPTLLQQVQTNLVSGTLPESAVSSVIRSSSLVVSTSDTTALRNNLEAAGTTATISDLIAVMTNGTYQIERYQSGYNSQTNSPTYNVDYGKIAYTSSNNRISFSLYDLSANSWLATSDSTKIYLTSSGWQEESSDYGTYNSSTGIYTSSGGGQRMKVSMVKYDLAGKAFSGFLSESSNYTGAPAGTFPVGSEAYRMTMTYYADTYRLSNGWQMCTQSDQNGHCTAYATTLSGLISSFSNTNANGSYTGSDGVWFKFGTFNSQTNSGTLYLYSPSTTSQPPQLITTSTYTIRTVNGVQMLVADARPAGGGYVIFAVYNGVVNGGRYYPANVAILSSQYDFNKTAINAIATAAGFPAIP